MMKRLIEKKSKLKEKKFNIEKLNKNPKKKKNMKINIGAQI